jgi:hypothetical protein
MRSQGETAFMGPEGDAKVAQGQRLGALGHEGQVHNMPDDNDGEPAELAKGPKRPMSAEDPSATSGMRHRMLQTQIGAQLRAIFSDVENAPVPERFLELLRSLEALER